MMRPQHFLFVAGLYLGLSSAATTCPPSDFETVSDFDLDAFISKRWWVQQQMEVTYLPKSQNRCVYAEYEKRKPGLLGYDVTVHNHAEDVALPHRVHDSGKNICAKIVDQTRGKLEVAPCFLPPSISAGPYWVVAYSESEGYALISGGAPKHSAEGGCRTGKRTNGSGLWIFTRQQAREQVLVDKVRSLAASIGFDLSVLNDVDQTQCNEVSAAASEEPLLLP